MTEILVSATLIASGVRALVVLSGLLVMFSSRERKIEWGRSMRVAFPEPFLLLLATVWLAAIGPIAPASVPGSHGAVASAAIVAGVLSSLFGVVLFAGSLWFNRGVGTGHYVDEDQVIVDAGPYAIIRHPLYAAAIFIWLGMSLSHLDWALLTFVYAYVIPAYYFYAKDEESMMVRGFGSAYTAYSKRVPMLFPRSLSIWH